MKKTIALDINNRIYEVAVNDNELLMEVLRKKIGLTGTKKGCGDGDCGACSVLIDGKTELSCIKLAVACEGKKITTVEGLALPGSQLNPLQDAFLEHGAVQCGFCTPGMLMSATGLLNRNPNPTRDFIKHEMSGNICRCTGYKRIIEAVEAAAQFGLKAGVK